VLALLTHDRLHEPYRVAAYPELPDIVAAARNAGAIGACLAGSGSTIAAFVAADGPTDGVGAAMRAASEELGLRGRAATLWPHPAGAHVIEVR
jgi:homoserine kinase